MVSITPPLKPLCLFDFFNREWYFKTFFVSKFFVYDKYFPSYDFLKVEL